MTTTTRRRPSAKSQSPKVQPRSDVEPGSTAITVGRHGAAPAGTVHLVDRDWNVLCGEGRMRYRFPGRELTAYADACPECASAVSLGRPASLAG